MKWRNMKWLNRRKEKSYKELWLMVYGFEEYSSGLIYRHQKAQERIEALDTTNEVLNRRIVKLEKDIVKLAEAQTEGQ